MSGRVIGFIVLTAILAIARAAPEDAETYVAAIAMGIIVLGWLALAGMVVFIAYAIVRGVMMPHARPPGRVPPGVEVSRCEDYPHGPAPHGDGGGCRRAGPVQVRAVQRDDGEGRHERDLRAPPPAAPGCSRRTRRWATS
jgi:hypothetical protein